MLSLWNHDAGMAAAVSGCLSYVSGGGSDDGGGCGGSQMVTASCTV